MREKINRFFKRYFHVLITMIIVGILVALDQTSKLIIDSKLFFGEEIIVIDDFFYITKVYNTGGGWSIFSDSTWLLTIISFLGVGIFLYMSVKNDFKKKIIYSISVSLMLAGTYGNLIDRLMTVAKARDGVIDFMGFYIGNYPFPIWNLADACLVVGVILLAVQILILDPIKEKKEQKSA